MWLSCKERALRFHLLLASQITPPTDFRKCAAAQHRNCKMPEDYGKYRYAYPMTILSDILQYSPDGYRRNKEAKTLNSEKLNENSEIPYIL